MCKTVGIILILVTLSSCSPLTKERYISNYQQFISDVKENRARLTENAWKERDKLFSKYCGEYYKKYENKLTTEEKILLTKYRLEYNVYRYGNKTEEALLGLFDSYIELGITIGDATTAVAVKKKNALKRQIENYIDNEMNSDVDFLIDNSKKIKNTFSRILDEFTPKQEE